MTIAFAVLPEKGHLNPYIGPAQALSDAGHEVIFAAPGDIEAQVLRAGLTFHRDLMRSDPSGRVTDGAELVSLIEDPAQLSSWIEQLLLENVPVQVEDLRRWYERTHPAVIVVDPLYYAAAIAAHLCGLPWAAVSNSLNPVVHPRFESDLLSTVRRLDGRRAALFHSYGMAAEFSVCDVLSPYLTMVFSTEALVGVPPHGIQLVGPSFPLRQRGDEVSLQPIPPDRPVVYASFGSQLYHQPAVFEKLLLAGESLNVHFILSIGDLIDESFWAAPIENCQMYRYAPQLEILRRASVFVTHGGANSVMEGIACGVPLLISPMCNDQFHQAYYLERAGIGLAEDLPRASVEQIRASLQRLLTDETISANVKRVSRTYEENGATRAAQLIANLAGANCP